LLGIFSSSSPFIDLCVAGAMQGEGGEGAGFTHACVLQENSQVGDDGARGLGEGLRVNSSLLQITLVSFLFFLV
jgi:hypothetical protein